MRIERTKKAFSLWKTFFTKPFEIYIQLYDSVRTRFALIFAAFYHLACAIFLISTGCNSIAEFEQTSPFLAVFQAHF